MTRASRPRPVDPIARFQAWFAEAAKRGTVLPECMALASADPSGRPAVRYVLLRGCDERGFVFYTDGRGRKARELRSNPRAAIAIYWGPAGKQVRIEGRVEEVDRETVAAYWARRSRQKQLAAAASVQDAPLASRRALLQRFRRLRNRYRGREIPLPASWTGFRLVPETIEFWVRREHRLHHRELFVRGRDGWCWRLVHP